VRRACVLDVVCYKGHKGEIYIPFLFAQIANQDAGHGAFGSADE